LGVNGYNIEDVMKLRGDELNEIIKKSPYFNATSDDINWINRVKTQAAIQQFICHSISSTVNLEL
jgi:ribonucleoside-diphosphate reductase alpha chain